MLIMHNVIIGLLGYYLPRYGTTLLADMVWGTLELVILAFFFQQVCLHYHSTPSADCVSPGYLQLIPSPDQDPIAISQSFFPV